MFALNRQMQNLPLRAKMGAALYRKILLFFFGTPRSSTDPPFVLPLGIVATGAERLQIGLAPPLAASRDWNDVVGQCTSSHAAMLSALSA
jgi:hypothetical protein